MATATATDSRTPREVDPVIRENIAARRALRIQVRKERKRAARSRAIRTLIYRFICWLELLPRRVGETSATFFGCAITLLLLAAVFFAALGVFLAAMSFWASFIPGW